MGALDCTVTKTNNAKGQSRASPGYGRLVSV